MPNKNTNISKDNLVDLIIVSGKNERIFENMVPEYLGISYIASYLKENGIDFRIHTITYQSALRIDKYFKQRQPTIVGFPLFSTNVDIVFKTAELLKSKFPQVHITIGGPNTVNYSQEILRDNPWVDSVVEGEGEVTMLELAQRVISKQSLAGCLGVTYRDDVQKTKLSKNPPRPLIQNLDILPFSSRTIFDIHPNIICSIMSSRGCSAYCTFCRAIIDSKQKASKVRACSIAKCLDEIEALNSKYVIELFVFWDSTFNDPLIGGEQRVLEFVNEVKKRNLDLSFIINTRAELITEDSRAWLKELSNIGLVSIEIGIESGNDNDLKLYGKPAKLVDNERAIKIIRDSIPYVNIKPEFISINPYSNYESLLKNFNFLYATTLGFHLQRYISILYVYPQATIKNKMIIDGLMHPGASYNADPLDYKFVESKVGELWRLLSTNLNTKKFDAIELLEKMLSILRAKVYRRLSQFGVKDSKYEFLFREFELLRQEENNKNYRLMCNCNNYLLDKVNQEQIIFWCKEANKTKFLLKLNTLLRKLFWLIFTERNSLKIINHPEALSLIAKMMGIPTLIMQLYLKCASLTGSVKKLYSRVFSNKRPNV